MPSEFFKALDTNADGEIDPDEVTHYEQTIQAKSYRYSLLNIPEPVISADTDFNRGVSVEEFRRAASKRFRLLDLSRYGTADPDRARGRTPSGGFTSEASAGREASGSPSRSESGHRRRPAALIAGYRPIQFLAAAGIRTVSVRISGVSRNLAGEARRPSCMSRQVEQVLLLLARRRQLLEIRRIDDHVTGRTGHDSFARPLERFPRGPGDVETTAGRRPLPLPCRGSHHFSENAPESRVELLLLLGRCRKAPAGLHQVLLGRTAA